MLVPELPRNTVDNDGTVRFASHDASPRIVPARTPEAFGAARRLFEEYARELGVDLAFQGFVMELATLPGAYVPPGGELLLAHGVETEMGCVALRPAGGKICEMKRLYVRPDARRKGLAGALVSEIIARARVTGYEAMVADTLDWMRPAIALYESFGFRRIPPYYDNPLPGVVYFRLELTPAAA